jgi:hypothetical protein
MTTLFIPHSSELTDLTEAYQPQELTFAQRFPDLYYLKIKGVTGISEIQAYYERVVAYTDKLDARNAITSDG